MEVLNTLSGALLGGLVASGILKIVFDKSLAAGLKAVHERSMLGAKAELDYRLQQLEEFYGPIYAYLKSSEVLYPLWMEGKLTEINSDIIQMFKAQNDHIQEILTNKCHLIDGDEMPEEFTAFTTSTYIWGAYCSRENEPYVPEHVAGLSQTAWPEAFQNHIYAKTHELKARLNQLYTRHKID